jgi:hypothetical protein
MLIYPLKIVILHSKTVGLPEGILSHPPRSSKQLSKLASSPQSFVAAHGAALGLVPLPRTPERQKQKGKAWKSKSMGV